MKKVILLLALFSSVCFAVEKGKDISASDIAHLRLHTSQHAYASIQKTALLNVPDLDTECSRGVFINVENDAEAYSTILAAVMSKSKVKIGFETTKKTPWGDARYCELTYLDLIN